MHIGVTAPIFQVKVIENMEHMSEEEFNAYFADSRTWTTVASSGETIELRSDLTPEDTVSYGDRMKYARLVQETRMCEFNKQVRDFITSCVSDRGHIIGAVFPSFCLCVCVSAL